jgi:hypothetical protein
LVRTADGLDLTIQGMRDGLLVSGLELAGGSEALLRLEAECAVATEVAVYVAPEGSAQFLPKYSARLELRPESPAAVVVLPTVTPRFELLVRPLPPARSLVLRDLEVRRVPVER